MTLDRNVENIAGYRFFPLLSLRQIGKLGLVMDATDHTKRFFNQPARDVKPAKYRFANQLRRNETEAEEKLWAMLRNRQLKGKKFRRQHAIMNYVADFYCHESKLVVEADGDYHRDPDMVEYDKVRTIHLNEAGITVLRFWNADIIKNPEKVIQKIAEYLQ
jgi:very-short-patch-repair endonuclease